jgi:hypothetical protein
VTRLVALDLGTDVSTGEVQAPSSRPSECDQGFSVKGETPRQVCIGGSCSGPCTERWKYIRGEFVIVSCPCR